MNKKGQASVEAVLIMTVLMGITIWVSQQFRSRGLISGLVQGPWSYIDGMAQHGVWGPARRVKAQDPNVGGRRVSTADEVER